jgi:hypothetical protein
MSKTYALITKNQVPKNKLPRILYSESCINYFIRRIALKNGDFTNTFGEDIRLAENPLEPLSYAIAMGQRKNDMPCLIAVDVNKLESKVCLYGSYATDMLNNGSYMIMKNIDVSSFLSIEPIVKEANKMLVMNKSDLRELLFKEILHTMLAKDNYTAFFRRFFHPGPSV